MLPGCCKVLVVFCMVELLPRCCDVLLVFCMLEIMSGRIV